MEVFHGSVLQQENSGDLSIRPDCWLIVQNGTITSLTQGEMPPVDTTIPTPTIHELSPHQILMPGFIDTHVHAAQIQYQGTGTDLPLMQWLEKYAFPSEKRLTKDLDLSKQVYTNLVDKLLTNGTTTCLYFGVMGVDSSKILVDVVREQGQRAMVGKVNMNRLAPEDYCETTEASLRDTEDFIEYVNNGNTSSSNTNDSSSSTNMTSKTSLVAPDITPRFVPSCTEELLVGLGKIAQRTGCRVQSHAVESVDCLECVEALHPGQDEVELLNNAGLLTSNSIMAHCVHINDTNAKLFQEQGVAIAHCPLSNFYFGGGALRAKAIMDMNIKIGLGTDIAGGYSHRMLDSIRHCVTTHLMVSSADKNSSSGKCHGVAPGAGESVERSSLNYKHAFWLATVGGAQALGIEHTVGKLKEGFEFDALLVDLTEFQNPLGEDTMLVTFEKFIHLGGKNNIQSVWVQGKKVK